MAGPRIKPRLQSTPLTTDPATDVKQRLKQCLENDQFNIGPQSRSNPTLGKAILILQRSLNEIRRKFHFDVAPAGVSSGMPLVPETGAYDPGTVAAVKWYKDLYDIRRSHQGSADAIIGRMTISQIDDHLLQKVAPAPKPSPSPSPTPSEPTILPTALCRQNKNIFLDGRTAIHRSPPIQPGEWVSKTQATLDTICSNQLGKQIVDAIRMEIVIKPYMENDINAKTGGKPFLFMGNWYVKFTADVLENVQAKAGGRTDEVLLHELIHILESNFGGYKDLPDKDLKFDGSDFITINGTNIYSISQSRQLRKDHRGLEQMPARYANDAREHMILFRENYEKAFDNNATLFNLFKKQRTSWNPFASFTRHVTKQQFLVEVSEGGNWAWIYDLFSDSTARWRDKASVADYGTGTWSQEGESLVVKWTTGGSDRFPTSWPGQTVDGRNTTGGTERASKVTRRVLSDGS